MALSNTAVPKYYGMFRDAVIRGEIPVCKEISTEMNRIDCLLYTSYRLKCGATILIPVSLNLTQ